MRTEISSALSAFDKDFAEIEGYDVIADGTYWAVAEDVALEITQPSGNPRMSWKFRILGPDHFGCRLRRDLVITTESLKWLKRDFYVCGLSVTSLADLPDLLDNLLNLTVRVRKQGKWVHILACDGCVAEEGHLFLHLVDEAGTEYLDQQLRLRQHPRDRQEFEALIEYFVNRYQCPRPHEAYVEDSKTGEVLFSVDGA